MIITQDDSTQNVSWQRWQKVSPSKWFPPTSSPQPDVKLMGTHLFASVTPTGTQNMVKDWDAKITLGNMENQLGKYNERQMAPLICFILLSSYRFRHTVCWRLNYTTEHFFISYFKGIGFSLVRVMQEELFGNMYPTQLLL